MNGIFADNTFWSKKTNSERHIRQIAFSLLMLIENNTNSLALENAKRKGTSSAPLPADFLSVSIESLVFVPRIGMNSGPRVHRLFLFNIVSENFPASAGGGMNRSDWKIGRRTDRFYFCLSFLTKKCYPQKYHSKTCSILTV